MKKIVMFLLYASIINISSYSQEILKIAVSEFVDGKTYKYSSKNSIDGSDINMTLKLPNCLIEKKSDFPNIFAFFDAKIDKNNGLLVLHIQKARIPSNYLKMGNVAFLNQMYSIDTMKEAFPNRKIIKLKQTEYDKQYGYIIITKSHESVAGVETNVLICLHSFIYSEQLITINCIYGFNETNNMEKLDACIELFDNLNSLIGTNILLLDTWRLK